MTLQYINKDGVHYHDLRPNLYWNKFQYRAKIRVPQGARMNPRKSLESFLNGINYYWLSDRTREYLRSNPDIHAKFHSWLNSNLNTEIVTRAGANGHVCLYCNDLAVLQTLGAVHSESLVLTKVAINNRVSDVKLFKNKPKHNYRIYLRTMRIPGQNLVKFIDWLQQNKDKFHMSPAFSSISEYRDLGARTRWLSSAYFIDYDRQSLESLLHLMWSDYLGKHYKLEQHNPDTTEELMP